MHNCSDTNIVLKIFVHINLLIPDFYNNVSIDFIEMRVDCQREAQLLSQSQILKFCSSTYCQTDTMQKEPSVLSQNFSLKIIYFLLHQKE